MRSAGKLPRAASVSLLLGLVVLPCEAVTHHVPSEYPTIAAGLAAATAGDTVLVAAGTYSGNGNRDIRFGGKDVVLRSEAGPEVTILDGSDLPPGGVHNGVQFYGTGETRACVIDGFTFRNFHGHTGSAIYIDGASPTITHCVFSNNSSGTEPLKGTGGAMGIFFSSALITDCRFENNSAFDQGGAVACGGSPGSSDLVFERCVFTRNQSYSYYWGGAVDCGWGGPFTFRDCLFAENRAAALGGAVSFYTGDMGGAAVFERCVFRDNESDDFSGSGDGGAIGAYTESSASLVVQDCSFFRNQAQSYGGAIACWGEVAVTLTGTTIAANSAPYGSGLALWIGSAGALSVIERSMIAFGGDFGTEGQAVYCFPGTALSAISCCDIYGNAGGDWVDCLAGSMGVEGNFSADPLFCDLDAGDLTLDARSPCLPGQHPGGEDCDLIGAYGVGCGATATQPSTWGAVKQMFR